MRFFAAEHAGAAPQPLGISKRTHRPAKLISPRIKKRLVRRLTVISIFAVAAIIFWFFLRYLTTEGNPSQESGVVSFYLTGYLS